MYSLPASSYRVDADCSRFPNNSHPFMTWVSLGYMAWRDLFVISIVACRLKRPHLMILIDDDILCRDHNRFPAWPENDADDVVPISWLSMQQLIEGFWTFGTRPPIYRAHMLSFNRLKAVGSIALYWCMTNVCIAPLASITKKGMAPCRGSSRELGCPWNYSWKLKRHTSDQT